MRTVALLLVAIAAVFAPLASATVASTNFTTFSAFFKGEWEVQSTTAPVFAPTTATTIYAPLLSTYTLHSDNVTMNLFGTSFDNNTATAEVTNVQSLAIDFADESGNKGFFSADGKKLFEFDFVKLPNGIAVSQGKWLAAENSLYVFTVFPQDKFSLAVLPLDAKAGAESHTFSGSRRIPNIPKTFFQSYGTFIMIGVMMIVNMYVQSKSKNLAAGAGNAPAEAAAAVAAPARPPVAAPSNGRQASKKAD